LYPGAPTCWAGSSLWVVCRRGRSSAAGKVSRKSTQPKSFDATRGHVNSIRGAQHTKEHEEAVNRSAAPFYKAIMLGLVAAAGWHIVPGAFTSSVPQSAKLVASKDVFMQRSGLSRIGMMLTQSKLHNVIIAEAHEALVNLLATSEEADIVESVLSILTRLATEGKDDEREYMCVDGSLDVSTLLLAAPSTAGVGRTAQAPLADRAARAPRPPVCDGTHWPCRRWSGG
jgi:hypothetical protein